MFKLAFIVIVILIIIVLALFISAIFGVPLYDAFMKFLGIYKDDTKDKNELKREKEIKNDEEN
jgi:uncharacterized protein YxeA